MISYKTCVVVSKVLKRVFPYYIWILIIYCSFKKREVKLGEIWCLTPFLTIFQLYHGYLVLSSNKGVLIAGIYIHTTVYINLKNTPPSKPQSIELEIRPSFSTKGYNCTPQIKESSSFVTQIRYTTLMKVVMVMWWSIATTWHPLSSVNFHN